MRKATKGKFSKWMVSAVIALIIIYTVVVLAIFCKTGAEPSVISGAFYAWATGELWALAVIKKHKTKFYNNTEENAEREEDNG